MKYLLRILLVPLISTSSLFAQVRIGTGKAQKLFNQYCADCHGTDLNNGMGGSLLNKEYKQVGKTVPFLEYVREGNPLVGMPSFKQALSDQQIRSLEIYISEKSQMHARQDKLPEKVGNDRFEASGVTFRLEPVITGLNLPWSIAFFPKGGGLITERSGRLRPFQGTTLAAPVADIPQVKAAGQGGLLEVALHPNYVKNGWIYLSYSHPNKRRESMTRIVRGHIRNNRWVNEQVIFEAPQKFYSKAKHHFGSRMVFDKGYLYFSIGDRGVQDQAQDLSRPNGKIHRIHDDGRVPRDNPFVGQDKAYPTIWTYGNRNPQGLDLHPVTGELWESEHGPRGGDEINLLEKGKNYGWPAITYGMNYNGTPVTDKTEAPGMEQPKTYWTPSISVCGIDFYEGSVFPQWKHNLLVGGLRSEELHRLVIREGKVVESEILIKGAGRIRDVASGPDGHPWLVLNHPHQVVRMVPVVQ